MSNNETQLKSLKESIEAKRKELERQEKQLVVSCNHKNQKGKLKIEHVYGTDGLFRCKKCGQEFSMDRIDIKKGLNAAEVLNDMIQQIRCLSGDSNKDRETNKQLGELAYNIGEVIDLYDKTIKAVGTKKKKKKEKDNNDSYGSYGWGGVSFSGRK